MHENVLSWWEEFRGGLKTTSISLCTTLAIDYRYTFQIYRSYPEMPMPVDII